VFGGDWSGFQQDSGFPCSAKIPADVGSPQALLCGLFFDRISLRDVLRFVSRALFNPAPVRGIPYAMYL
jgi:hypothetical protein